MMKITYSTPMTTIRELIPETMVTQSNSEISLVDYIDEGELF